MHLVDYRPLWLLLVLVPVAWALARSLVDRRRWLLYASQALTALAIVLTTLALCRPYVDRSSQRVHVAFVVDVSASVDQQAAQRSVDQVREWIDQLGPGDGWDLYAVGDGCRRTTPGALPEQLAQWRDTAGDDAFVSHSRLADALLTARLDMPAGAARRVVVFSDGRETDGDLASAIAAMRREGVDVRRVQLGRVGHAEAAVTSLRPGTPHAYVGQRVRLTARLSSNVPTGGTLRILNRGVVEAECPVQLRPGDDNEVTVDVTMTTAGASVWEAELVCEDDHYPINNRSGCTVQVRGRAKVLAMHERPAELRALKAALASQGIDLDVRGEHGMPSSLAQMLQFDAIVLASLPATAMETQQMVDLKRYVADFGGGLAMLGSDNSFGLGGYYRTPVEEVLPIVSRYEKEKEQPSMAMVMVIDKSGSMEGLPIALARQAAKAAVELLSARDQVGVVAFDGSPFIVAEMSPASDAHSITASIDQIIAGGGTNMYPAMAAGERMLFDAGAKIKHMLILSDGQSMPGDFQGLAAQMADAGMTVSTVALGDGADAALMQALARIGRGRFYQTSSPDTVPRIFTKETIEASRSAIREEPFLPVRVGKGDLLEGIDFDEAPFLLGYVLSRPKPTAQMLLVTESGDPLLAVGRYGLGRSLAFTSDASDAWATEWMRWGGFGKFWAQALRACMRPAEHGGVTVQRSEDGSAVRYDIAVRDEADRPVSNADWQAVWLTPDGQRRELAVAPTGLGRYELNCPGELAEAGTLRLYDRANDTLKVIHERRDYPAEYLLAAEADAAFEQLPELAGSVRDGLTSVTARRAVGDVLLVAALACMIGSILLRRL
jgi:uncharacterized membrane protein